MTQKIQETASREKKIYVQTMGFKWCDCVKHKEEKEL